MPRSGGGYYFVSRSLWTGVGAIVGLGLWLGLVFAAAFYLVGLGHYVVAVFAEVGTVLSLGLLAPHVVLGLLFGATLTALSVATFVFGMPATQVAERFLGPVLVVAREAGTDSEA